MGRNAQAATVPVFCQVLERLAFMFAEPMEKNELESLEGEAFHADIRFTGPQSGAVRIAAPEPVARAFAASILGLESSEDVPDSSAEDALKEMVNVICGQLLTAIAGDRPQFQLTVPEAGRLDGDSWETMAGTEQTLAFRVDYEYPVLLEVILD